MNEMKDVVIFAICAVAGLGLIAFGIGMGYAGLTGQVEEGDQALLAGGLFGAMGGGLISWAMDR